MVALNPDFAPSQAEADTHEARQRVDGEPKASPKDGLKRVPEVGQFEPQNRVGGFFSLAAESVGVNQPRSRNRIVEKRAYTYETASVDTEYEYSPFGEVIRSIGSYADVNPFRFSTKYLDLETGFYYYGYRHYDPATGRWLSKDPLGEAGGTNLYSFVENGGVNYWDYLGLKNPNVHRVEVTTTIRPGSPNPGQKSHHTTVVDTSTGESASSHTTGRTDITPGASDRFSLPSVRNDFNSSVTQTDDSTTVHMDGTTASVAVPANIDYDLDITINHDTSEVTVEGSHDGFPSYTVEVDGEVVYDHQQECLLDLFGDGDDVDVNTGPVCGGSS